MDKTLSFILSLTILLPLITGIIRFRSLPKSYYPIIILLGVGVLNELISYTFFYKTSNAVPSNLYCLAEALLYCVQFRLWGHTLNIRWYYYSLMSGIVLVWLIENIVLKNIFVFSPVYLIFYSLILILLAVNELNWLIINERRNILKNAIFLFCTGIILFFSYKALMEIFYFYAPDNTAKKHIFGIESYINICINFLYTAAILCIPRKVNFIRLS